MGGMVLGTMAILMTTDTKILVTGIVVIMAQSVVSVIGDRKRGRGKPQTFLRPSPCGVNILPDTPDLLVSPLPLGFCPVFRPQRGTSRKKA